MSNTRAWTFALLLLAAAPAFAQEAPAAGANPPAPVAWSSLAPEQQKLLSRYEGQWNSLPPARQQALAHGSERWLGMSAEQRDKARDRFSHWQSLPPEQRHALRSRWQKFQALPPAPLIGGPISRRRRCCVAAPGWEDCTRPGVRPAP
jgi:hypothetical protein